MNNQEKYLRSQYESERRHYKREYESLVLKTSRFVNRTYELLKLIGMSEEEMRDWYARRY